MKRLTWILVGLSLSIVPTCGFAKDNAAKTAAQLTDLETVWNQAHLHGDVDALDKLWADSLTVTVPEMPPFSKTSLIKMWRGGTTVSITEYATSDLKVHVYGASAVVTGRGRSRSGLWREQGH